MPTWAWIVIGVGAAAVLAVVLWLTVWTRRRMQLRQRFGPEYERTVSRRGGRRKAERELREREKRRETIDVHPLEPEAQVRYRQAWQQIQAEFVDEPDKAVHEADALIEQVMRDRGYPVEDFEEQASIISVDHPTVVEHYRAGHRLSHDGEGNGTSTEELRQAMVHFRTLFEELVGAGHAAGEETRS